MLQWIRPNWFLLALASVYAFGHFNADSLAAFAETPGLRSAVVVMVMWAMGVTLKPDAIKKSLSRPTASLLAIGTNAFLVPALCLPGMWLLSPQLGGGLFVAALVPCTLASASVWTRKAGGDDSIAMMTTVVTNLGCLVIVPLGIQIVLALHARVAPLDQMEKLAWFVVMPLLIAQLVRRFGGASWADRNKQRLAFVAQIGILVMVFFGAIAGSGYGKASEAATEAGWSLGIVAVWAVGVHLIAMSIGILGARGAGLPRSSQIAVGISGSQKTLMVGLQIAIDCGVSVVPMLIYHVGQLLTDTLIAERWKGRSNQE